MIEAWIRGRLCKIVGWVEPARTRDQFHVEEITPLENGPRMVSRWSPYLRSKIASFHGLLEPTLSTTEYKAIDQAFFDSTRDDGDMTVFRGIDYDIPDTDDRPTPAWNE